MPPLLEDGIHGVEKRLGPKALERPPLVGILGGSVSEPDLRRLLRSGTPVVVAEATMGGATAVVVAWRKAGLAGAAEAKDVCL